MVVSGDIRGGPVMRVVPQQLQQIQVFAGLNAELLKLLAQKASRTSYPAGEVLIHEGDRFPACFHAVLEGELQAIKIAASGKETILRTLPAGQMFAAPALFGDGIAVATVKALRSTEVVRIPKPALLEAIQLDPDVALQILACFNHRLQEMHRTVHGLVSEQAIVRLTRLVQYSAQQYGTHSVSGGHQLNIQLSYHQIARSIGISYEESVRLMGQKLSHILVYRRGGTITILDAPALDAIASGEQPKPTPS
ncbi:Crp/Fnr family transcriptional regulator [Acaryochloris sp. IP29b_bin.148]|uniref:Crp/Fnr family transcriptional regulator n=1 Tax=Acaryochloris sp. IP29b_bin.148 TaxID=2969218 RepID=UPI0026106677|nr:Crp/Fnr family transcriptional regulator [Acaryochloris sp. IP29b_bin.148]